MREAFPSLPFKSSVAKGILFTLDQALPLLALTLHSIEQIKQFNAVSERNFEAVPSIFKSISIDNTNTTLHSLIPPSNSEPIIVITEKIIINSECKTIKETLVDNHPVRDVIPDTDSTQSHAGNLPSTVASAASTTASTGTTTANPVVLAVSTTTASSGFGSGNAISTSVAAAISKTPCFSELEELQNILHFPEEVALRITDTEYQLFYQVNKFDLANE